MTRRRCTWCAVRLRWWQRRRCRTCARSERLHTHLGKGEPWCPRGSRHDAEPDRAPWEGISR